MCLIQFHQFWVQHTPNVVILRLVIDYWNVRVAHLVTQCSVTDIDPSLIVSFVCKTRVIDFNYASIIFSYYSLSDVV